MRNVQAQYCRDLPVYLVCPHCKQETAKFFVECDGYGFPIHRCGRHGDVIAIRSHVRNETILEAADGLPFPIGTLTNSCILGTILD